ncbi:MAG: hypothetical protein GY950_03200 [bacterium]|nr:hypothetical protein [bacterium]
MLFFTGCGVKTQYLPQVSYPYVAEMNFFKEVKNVNGKAKKKRFKDDRVTSPFYFLLKIKEIENSGTVTVRFYESLKTTGRRAAERSFQFGKPGKYYEYVMFFDRVEELSPGRYRYTIFYNGRLLYDDFLDIAKKYQ